jgi:peptidoglycan/LPS O-acetylase OafA/YrhL
MQGWFNGFLGVDVFFVLSGFVNGLLIQKSSEVNQITFSKYLNRRFFRIVIPTWVSIVMVVLVSWTVTFFLKSYRIPALLLLLIIPVFFNPNSIWNPYEPKPINALEIYEVIQLGFTNPMMLEFALGLIGAWVYHWVFHLKQIPLKPNWTPTIAWGLAIIVAISVLFLIFTPVQRHGIWPNGLVAFALVMGLAFQETIVKQKYHKFLVYLGTLSFPLFLTHTGWIAIWHQVWPKWNPYVPFGWAILISLILSFALAHGFGKALKIL